MFNKGTGEFKEEVYVMYDKAKIQKRFSKNIITRIQDIFVASCNNVLFIEHTVAQRKKIHKYIHKISSNDTHLILIGNHDTLPFETIKSPVNDGDKIVHTDNFWACNDAAMLIPDLSVARIPHSKNEKENEYLKKIENILENVNINFNEKVGVTASIWDKSSIEVFEQIKGTGEIIISPPFSIKKNGLIKFKKFMGTIYCNVHGSKDIPGWYGQAKQNEISDEEYPRVLMPETFKDGFKSTYLVSEACYGGFIINKRDKESIALSALKGGIKFTLLSTSTAYGPYRPPLSEADLLADLFYKELYKGKSAGKALREAKKIFARKGIKKYGFLDNDDKKTLLEFHLYGNPLLRKI